MQKTNAKQHQGHSTYNSCGEEQTIFSCTQQIYAAEIQSIRLKNPSKKDDNSPVAKIGLEKLSPSNPDYLMLVPCVANIID